MILLRPRQLDLARALYGFEIQGLAASLSDLAIKLACTEPAVQAVLRGMVEAGYVTHETGKSRSWRLTPTLRNQLKRLQARAEKPGEPSEKAFEGLAQRQAEALRTIYESIRLKGRAPTITELAGTMKVARSTAKAHIDALVERRILRRVPGRSAGLTIKTSALQELGGL